MSNQECENTKKNEVRDEIDLTELIKTIWAEKKLIFVITTITLLCGLTYAMLITPLYQASTTFYALDNQKGGSSQLGAAAAMLGMGGGVESSNKGYKISDVLRSRKVREKLAKKKWRTDNSRDSVSLYDFWHIEGSSSNDKLENLLLKLNKIVMISEPKKSSLIGDGSSGLYEIKVKTEDRELSKNIANEIVKAADIFLREAKNKNILESIEFIDLRLKANKKELASAEINLKEFKKRNQILVSAELQLESARLQREVMIKQEVYLTLVKQKEMSLIEVVKESNTVSVMDEAIRPEKKISPKRAQIVVISFVFGLIFGIVLITVRNMLQQLRRKNA